MHDQDANNPHRREYRVLLLPTDDTIDEFARQIDMAVGHTTFTVTHKSRSNDKHRVLDKHKWNSVRSVTAASVLLQRFIYRHAFARSSPPLIRSLDSHVCLSTIFFTYTVPLIHSQYIRTHVRKPYSYKHLRPFYLTCGHRNMQTLRPKSLGYA